MKRMEVRETILTEINIWQDNNQNRSINEIRIDLMGQKLYDHRDASTNISTFFSGTNPSYEVKADTMMKSAKIEDESATMRELNWERVSKISLHKIGNKSKYGKTSTVTIASEAHLDFPSHDSPVSPTYLRPTSSPKRQKTFHEADPNPERMTKSTKI